MDVKATIKSVGPPPVILDMTPESTGSQYRAKGGWHNFIGGTYQNVSFVGSRFDVFNAAHVSFSGCDFTGAKMKGGAFGGGRAQSVFRDCIFDRSDLHHALPCDVRFERCSFENTKIDGWRADGAEFVDCTFTGRIRGARFTGSPRFYGVDLGRERNEFHGNDFTGAELIEVEFVLGIDLRANRLPTSPDYAYLDRRAERIERARADIARWEDDRERERALLELRIFSEGGYRTQPDLFVRRADLVPRMSAVRDRLLALLEAPLA